MKKAVLFGLAAVGLATLFLVNNSASQDRRLKALQDPSPFRFTRPRPSVDLIDDTTDRELEQLRKQLLELFQQRLQTMDKEELTARIDLLRSELREHEANAKLKEARELLRGILQVYPDSRAAGEARRMLDAGAPAEKDAAAEEPEEPVDAEPFE